MCSIFQYMKGVNDKPGTPNYDLYRLALKSTSKRLYPNYCQTLWTVNSDGTYQDKIIKNKVIDSLSEEDYDKLIQFGLNNPKQFEQLGLTLEPYD